MPFVNISYEETLQRVKRFPDAMGDYEVTFTLNMCAIFAKLDSQIHMKRCNNVKKAII